MSRYIIKNKHDYYTLLQKVRDENAWEEWIMFMLDAIQKTAEEGLIFISNLQSLMIDFKDRVKTTLPKIYSQDLVNNLFRYPYTKIEFLQRDLEVSRNTAIRHLEMLVKKDFLKKTRIGRNSFFVNERFFSLLKT